MIFKKEIMDMITSILQDVPTYYNLDKLPDDQEMKDLLKKLMRNVVVIFGRLAIGKESPSEFMAPEFQKELLYNNYMFTIPIIFDLCQHFGRENDKMLDKMLSHLFALQPSYMYDVETSISFILQVRYYIFWRYHDIFSHPTILIFRSLGT